MTNPYDNTYTVYSIPFWKNLFKSRKTYVKYTKRLPIEEARKVSKKLKKSSFHQNVFIQQVYMLGTLPKPGTTYFTSP